MTDDLNVPASEPPSISSSDGVLDLGKERELRALRTQVEQLSAQLAEYSTHPKPQLLSKPRIEETHGYRCGYHPRVLVSMETASVVCEVCGAELSPLEVLREFANGERLLLQTMEHMRAEKKRLAEAVGKLTKQRASLRSQVRKKGGTVPDDPGATRPSAAEYYKLLHENVRLRTQLQKAGLDERSSKANARSVDQHDAAAADRGGDQERDTR